MATAYEHTLLPYMIPESLDSERISGNDLMFNLGYLQEVVSKYGVQSGKKYSDTQVSFLKKTLTTKLEQVKYKDWKEARKKQYLHKSCDNYFYIKSEYTRKKHLKRLEHAFGSYLIIFQGICSDEEVDFECICLGLLEIKATNYELILLNEESERDDDSISTYLLTYGELESTLNELCASMEKINSLHYVGGIAISPSNCLTTKRNHSSLATSLSPDIGECLYSPPCKKKRPTQ